MNKTVPFGFGYFGSSLALGLAFALLLCPSDVSASSRTALVIGIDRYEHLPDLSNAARDAEAIAEQLESLGFETFLHLNIDNRELYRALRQFEGRLATRGGTGLVFFAGHGIQSDGRNYLIPSDARIEVKDDLVPESLDAASILESMARAGNPLNIFVLDACRDNPLPNRTRSASRGLTVTSIPSGAKGTAILYAAGEGQVAQDGPKGGHGVFTEALLSALKIPGLKLEEVIKQVTRGVVQRTNGNQRPWSLASIQGDFYFNLQTTPRRTLAPTEITVSREKMAQDVWDSIKQSDDRDLLKDFASRFADTPYAMAANARLAILEPLPRTALTPATKPEVVRATEVASEVRKFGPHEMVRIEGQCYMIGSSQRQPGRQGDEKPSRSCFDTFWIDRYEVTFDAYESFAKETGHKLPDDEGMGRGLHPVINVDWEDARAYAAWATKKYGVRFRLPTEAEWEFACRGGKENVLYCGSDEPHSVAVFNTKTTEPVGSKEPNALGLYDMSGNAWEMTCSDYNNRTRSIDTAYDGSQMECIERSVNRSRSLVFRGGDWQSGTDHIRASRRRTNDYGSNGFFYAEPIVDELGFRLVLDLQ